MINKKELSFVAVVIVAIIALCFLPTGFENPELLKNSIYERAVVVSVDNSDVENITVVSVGTQRLELEIKTGKFKGEVVESRNVLLGNKQRDKIFAVGDKVLSVSKLNKEHTEIVDSRAEDFYRQDVALVLIIAFAICLIIFAGKTGAKAAISFIFTALAFWKLLIPALLRGYSPLFTSIGIVFITTLVIILLVGGISRKGFVALSGATLGVVATALLALLFGHYFKIPGTVQNYAESLMYIGYANLNFSEMFISCIFISSAGAVMDVAMDIAAAQDELSVNAPHLTTKELIRSGLNVASPVVGSMTTTLLFAYSGSFMFAFMAFMAQGAPMESIVNRAYISAEILHTMVGSFGLVLVAPITAVLGGYIYKYATSHSH
ncbi:MAG: YibE/F family protein [Rikenellaceae bacterium]